MQQGLPSTYIAGNSSVHRLDARSKIIMLAFYSGCLFFVDTWVGMALMAALFAAALVCSRLPCGRVFGMGAPVYILAAFTVAANSFLYDYGAFTFSEAGLVRGCFFAARILLLVWASLVVCFATSTTSMMDALNWFLRPLRRVGVPADDVAMVFSIALRFIPVMSEEFWRVRAAQWARGAEFDSGGLVARLRAYAAVLIPMFVELFRRADNLADAMDARCYGAAGAGASVGAGAAGVVARTSLRARRMTAGSVAVTLAGCAVCLFVAFAL